MGCSSEAGKTGTSEELSDAWFVGFTPLFSTAVWVGHPQSREYTGFGGPTAGPIWQNFMENAVAGECPEFEVPSNLPELHGLSSSHTRSSGEVAPKNEEFEEEDEEKSKKDEEKSEAETEGGDQGGEPEQHEAAPPPEEAAAPPPAPPPAPHTSVGGGIAAPH
jgi:penicillin-binding protein 1A